MARTRNIKPGFFGNDLLAECDPLARLLFAGLWCWADRAGRIEYRVKKIKAAILPYDDCDIDALVDQLEKRKFVQRYTVGEAEYLQVLKFSEHQNPHMKEPESTIPEPDKSGASPVQAGPSSLTLIPQMDSSSGVDTRGEPISVSPEVEIIRAFDAERVAAFGESLARSFPGGTDHVFAQRWISAGATVDICRSVFAAGFRRAAGKKTGPPDTLSYFDKPVANAIAEKNRPATPAANGHGSEPYDANDDYQRMHVII